MALLVRVFQLCAASVNLFLRDFQLSTAIENLLQSLPIFLFQGLVIISCGTDVAGGVRGPGDAVDTGTVVVEPRHGGARYAHVQDDDLHPVHGHGGQVVEVLLVPAQPEQRVVLRVFVDDGAVLQVPQVKHPHPAVGPHRGEHVPAPTRAAERDVVHLFVVGDQLCLHVAGHQVHSAQHLPSFQAPDSAGRVNAGRAQQVGVHFVPIEVGQGGAEVGVFVVVQ
ncbi:hypothetical protein FKM82_006183 [Ascaphus truei]